MKFCHINGSFISYLDEGETCYCSCKISLLMFFKKVYISDLSYWFVLSDTPRYVKTIPQLLNRELD